MGRSSPAPRPALTLHAATDLLPVPGGYLDELRIPTDTTDLVWSNVPVVVKSLTGPDGATVDGLLGSNLLGNRDYVFNGAGTPDRYLDVSYQANSRQGDLLLQ